MINMAYIIKTLLGVMLMLMKKMLQTGASLALILALSACYGEKPYKTGYFVSNTNNLFAQEQFEQNENYDLARKYHHGIGVTKNHKTAMDYYKKAIVTSEDTRAMNEYGTLLISGSGISKNPKLGFSYISVAADKGNSSARFNMGLSFYHGFYLVHDQKRGLELIYTSANQGNPHAQAFLAEWLDKDYKQEAESNPDVKNWAAKVIDNGMVEYFEMVSRNSEYRSLWRRFFETETRDRKPMLSDLMALESSCFECKSEYLGTVSRKLTEMQTLREKSEAGDPVAKYNLGLAYLNGNGAPKNLEEGARLMVVSADAGYIPAQYALGKIFLEGKGVIPNRSMAYAWFLIASKDQQGYRESDWARTTQEWMETYIPQGYLAVGQEWASEWKPNSNWYVNRK